ncbi:Uncharacterized protein GBIM_19046 [Gryllus bimaculatus]|nr:Uncharacterized protein GBIM_19046 [Gryllus bimaculatus]
MVWRETRRRLDIWQFPFQYFISLLYESLMLRCEWLQKDQKMARIKTINDLPDEILVEIFSYLTVEDLATRVRKVCSRWEEVAKENKLWRNLTYTPSNKTSLDQIIEVLKGAPKLQMFIPEGEYINGQLLKAVVTYCKDIRSLKIRVNKADNILVLIVVFFCRSIEDLSIETEDFVSTKYLLMVSLCPKLRHLKLSGQTVDNNDSLFSDILNGFPSLRRLDISNLHYKHNDLKCFLKQNKNKLHYLCVNCCPPAQSCLLPVLAKYCTVLEILHVFGHRGISSSAEFSCFKNMKHLKDLSVIDFQCNNIYGAIDYFESGVVHNLHSLKLSNFGTIDKRLTNAIFTKCLNLKDLNLGKNNSLTDDCLQFIGNLIYLEYLYLCGCNALTTKGVSYIFKCSKLKYVNLNKCKNITRESLEALCINLKRKRFYVASSIGAALHCGTWPPKVLSSTSVGLVITYSKF